MHARLPLRLVRAAAFSAVCVALATLGHVVAGGSGPEPWAVAAGGSAVLTMSLLLAGRERSTAAISTGLSLLQLSLHELFVLSEAAGVPVTPHPHVRGLGEDLGMLIAHLTAALVTGWWLARGETALWALLRAARHHLDAPFRLLPPPVAATAPRRSTRTPVTSVFARAVLRHSVSRRGPPLPAA